MSVNVGQTAANKDIPFIKWLADLPELLDGLDKRRTVVFLAACCERQFGNYVQFHRETGWGDPQVLCDGLQALWNYTSATEVAGLRRQAIKGATPDTEDFTSVYTSAALDAAISLHYSLDYCVDGDVSHCLRVACSCLDSVCMFVQFREGYDYSDADQVKTYADPLVVRELQAQRTDLEFAKSSGVSGSVTPLKVNGCDPDGGSLRL